MSISSGGSSAMIFKSFGSDSNKEEGGEKRKLSDVLSQSGFIIWFLFLNLEMGRIDLFANSNLKLTILICS